MSRLYTAKREDHEIRRGNNMGKINVTRHLLYSRSGGSTRGFGRTRPRGSSFDHDSRI